jgi:hypothetical protein
VHPLSRLFSCRLFISWYFCSCSSPLSYYFRCSVTFLHVHAPMSQPLTALLVAASVNHFSHFYVEFIMLHPPMILLMFCHLESSAIPSRIPSIFIFTSFYMLSIHTSNFILLFTLIYTVFRLSTLPSPILDCTQVVSFAIACRCFKLLATFKLLLFFSNSFRVITAGVGGCPRRPDFH